MKNHFRFFCCVVTLALTAVTVRADETTIAIDALANEPWTFTGAPGGASIINGYTFPDGVQNFGGIPFAIPTGPSNYWSGAAAADFGSGVVSLTVPVGVYGVTSAFTLLNTFWGWAGPTAYLSVTFTGSEGASVTAPLVGNVNVRDYNNDGNTNSINNTSTTEVWNNGLGQRLDRQEYVLPGAFASQTLTSVTITDSGAQGNGTNGSRAVFSGLTVSTCAAYATETIRAAASQITYDATNGLYTQAVSLTNTGTAAVKGPLFFILEDLTAGVTLASKSGATACFAPLGSRYVVPLGEGSSLAPDTSVDFRLWFSDPAASAITYTRLIAGSLGGLP